MGGVPREVVALHGPGSQGVPRGAAAVVRIAPEAGGDEITRRLVAPLRTWLHVSTVSCSGVEHLAGIHAPELVPLEDLGATIRHPLRESHA